MNRIKYLDGLRGVAVVLVIFFHLNIFTQGFAGVECFFVLSGFIITFLLVQEWERKGSIGITNFYIRRVRRIAPPLLVLLMGTILLFINFPIASISDKFTHEAWFTTVGATNWYEVIHATGYWESGVKSPLLHMWSIAIEIQFYLFWPFIAKASLKRTLRFFLGTTLCLLIACWLGTGIYAHYATFNTLYYSTETRMSSFLVGALFAILATKLTDKAVSQRIKTYCNYLAYICACAMIAMLGWFQLNDQTLFQGKIAAFTFVTGALLFCLGQSEPKNGVRWLLENPISFNLGRVSYSLYLWHIPVIIFVTPENLQALTGYTMKQGAGLIILQLGLSLFLATVSYLLIEKGVKFSSLRAAIFTLLLFPTVVGLLLSSPVANSLKWVDSQPTVAEKWQNSPPIVTAGKSPLLIVGDSWSRRIAFGLDHAQKVNKEADYQLLVYGNGNGSMMDPDYFIENGEKMYPFKSFSGYLAYWQEAINRYHPQKVLLITGNADQALMVVKGQKMRVGSAAFQQRYLAQFKQVVAFFEKQHIKIYLTNVPNNAHTNADTDLNQYSTAMKQVMDKAVQESGQHVTYLDMKGLLAGNTKNLSPKVLNSRFMYDETNHPSYDGATYIGQWLLKKIAQ